MARSDIAGPVGPCGDEEAELFIAPPKPAKPVKKPVEKPGTKKDKPKPKEVRLPQPARSPHS